MRLKDPRRKDVGWHYFDPYLVDTSLGTDLSALCDSNSIQRLKKRVCIRTFGGNFKAILSITDDDDPLFI